MIQILTDPGCGLSSEELSSLGVTILPYVVKHGSKIYLTKNDWDTISKEEQLDLFTRGFNPTYSRPSLGEWVPFIDNIFKEGKDILYVAISQKTSNSISSINIISNLVKGQYPERQIGCVDTKLIGRAQGYLVKKAVELRDQNFSLEEIEKELEELKSSIKVVWLPGNIKAFQNCGRGDASEIENEEKYVALTCGPNGKFMPWKTFTTKQEAIDYIKEEFNEYSYLEVSYTVGTEHLPDDFKNLKIFQMPPFTSSALGIDSQEYTFIK